jgi:hypothetical protein
MMGMGYATEALHLPGISKRSALQLPPPRLSLSLSLSHTHTHTVPLYCKQPVYCYDVSKHSSKMYINTHTITLLISVSVLDIVKEVQVILFKVLAMAIQVH